MFRGSRCGADPCAGRAKALVSCCKNQNKSMARRRGKWNPVLPICCETSLELGHSWCSFTLSSSQTQQLLGTRLSPSQPCPGQAFLNKTRHLFTCNTVTVSCHSWPVLGALTGKIVGNFLLKRKKGKIFPYKCGDLRPSVSSLACD